jgi:hypothetical protein
MKHRKQDKACKRKDAVQLCLHLQNNKSADVISPRIVRNRNAAKQIKDGSTTAQPHTAETV